MASPDGLKTVFEAISLLLPYDIDVPKIRYGSAGDGGYVFADTMRPDQPVISLGVGWSCDLEYDFAKRGHKVTMFDPTVAKTPRDHPHFTFHSIGVDAADSPDGRYLSLDHIVAKSGLSGRTDLILKIDVEGAEFRSVAAADPATLAQFEQIAIEIHWLSKLEEPGYRDLFVKAMGALAERFYIFHVHANNYDRVRFVGGVPWPDNHHTMGAFPVPEVMELSLVRKDKATASPLRTLYPTEFDLPNEGSFPDHILCFYPFLPMASETAELLRKAADRNERLSMARRKPNAPAPEPTGAEPITKAAEAGTRSAPQKMRRGLSAVLQYIRLNR